MSVLAFTTPPWAIATLYCGLLRRAPLSHTYVAVCIWMFSASWSYDLYLLLRDGYYPVTWQSNIFASSILYVCAGLTWNLERHPRRGVIFGFMEPGWPQPHPSDFRYPAWYALPFMILVAAIILSFLIRMDHRADVPPNLYPFRSWEPQLIIFQRVCWLYGLRLRATVCRRKHMVLQRGPARCPAGQRPSPRPTVVGSLGLAAKPRPLPTGWPAPHAAVCFCCRPTRVPTP